MKTQLRQLAVELSGKRAVDWRALTLAATLLFVFAYISYVGHSERPARFVVIAVMAGLFFEILLALVLRPLFAPAQRTVSIWRIWALYWLVGETGGVWAIWSLEIPFGEPGRNLSAWSVVFYSGFIAVIWYSLAHLFVGLLRTNLELLKRLNSQSKALHTLRAQASTILEADLIALRKMILDKVMRTLGGIEQQVEDLGATLSLEGLTITAGEIQNFCDEVVRNLSHNIGASMVKVSPAMHPAGVERYPFGESITSPRDIQSRWQWVSAIGFLNTTSIALQHGGWIAFSASIIGIGCAVGMLGWLEKLRLRWTKPKTVAAAIGLILFEYLVVTEALLGLWKLIGLWQPEVARFATSVQVIMPIIALLIWGVLQLIEDFQRGLVTRNADLVVQNDQLRLEVEIIQQKSQVVRRRLGRLLHGSVQGKLASVALALRAASTLGNNREVQSLVAQAQEQLRKAQQDLQSSLASENRFSNFAAELDALTESWRNLVTIEWVADEAVAATLASDPELAECVVDALQECVTNAVRHGNARRVSAICRLDETLTLEIRNDGAAYVAAEKGFGLNSISLGAEQFIIDVADGQTRVQISWHTPLGLSLTT